MNERTWKCNIFPKPVGDQLRRHLFRHIQLQWTKHFFEEIDLAFLAALSQRLEQQRSYFITVLHIAIVDSEYCGQRNLRHSRRIEYTIFQANYAHEQAVVTNFFR